MFCRIPENSNTDLNHSYLRKRKLCNTQSLSFAQIRTSQNAWTNTPYLWNVGKYMRS